MGDSHTGSIPPRRAESRLVKAVSDSVKKRGANPDRVDCPNSEAIQAIAARRLSHPNFDDTVDHIAMCAPCFEEYNRRRREYRIRRRRPWVVGVAAMLILGLIWTYHLTREPGQKNQLAYKTPAPPLAVTLNYSDWSAERSASPSLSKRVTPTVARTRLALTLVLPIGTEDGAYSVQIRSASGEIVAQANGIATWISGAEKLNINLDLTPLSAGRYTIAIQSADASPHTYPVLLE